MNHLEPDEPDDGTDSLDSYFRGSSGNPVTGNCPVKGNLKLVNVRTGETIRLRCQTNRCVSCAWRRALRIGYAIRMSHPTQMVTLTFMPWTFPEIKRTWEQLRERLMYHGWRFEWAYAAEQPTLSTRPHVHIFLHGSRLPPREVWGEAATASGLGVDLCEKWESRGPDTYPFKSIVNTRRGSWRDGLEVIDAHLHLNGGLILHSSRNFWRDEDGTRIAGMREAIRARNMAPSDSDDWIVIAEQNVARYLQRLRDVEKTTLEEGGQDS